MRKVLLASVAVIIFATPAFASEGGCIGNCETDIDIEVEITKNLNENFNTAEANSVSDSNSVSEATGGNSISDATGGNAAISGDITNSVNFDRAASTAYAAALTASAGTCMGSTSVGGQGVGFGVSIGSTWSDSDCNRRRYSAMLMSLGEDAAAIQLLCLNEEVAQVMGAKCN